MSTKWAWTWPPIGAALVFAAGFLLSLAAELESTHFIHVDVSSPISTKHVQESSNTNKTNLHKGSTDGIPEKPQPHKEITFTRTKVGISTSQPSRNPRNEYWAPHAAIDGKLLTNDLVSRLTWWIAAMAQFLALVVTTIVALYTIKQSLTVQPSERRRIVALIACTLYLIPLIALITRHPLRTHLSANILDVLVAVSGLCGIVLAGNFFSSLAASVIFVVIIAFSTTLVFPRQVPKNIGNLIAERSRRLQFLLYICATLLIIGVFHLFVLHRLPAAHMLDADSRHMIDTVAAGLASSYGLFFTFLLGAVYIPAATAMRIHAHNIVPRKFGGTGKERIWLAKKGLYASPTQQLTRLLAILGPMLVGALGKIINVL